MLSAQRTCPGLVRRDSSIVRGADPVPINFDGDRTLQQVDGQHKLQSRFDSDYDPAQAPQRTFFDPGNVADFQVWPWHRREAALFDSLYRGNLVFLNGYGRTTRPGNLH